ncbi:glycosyltransferase [Thalassovita mangrovi]|uniref:Glycosyltransferase n=1 Tax=Thalassovita mangrovi TaxID=2692236 RepID=A0A6L8LI22_9RHOB|nr:glycosyltransferase family 2 protein [Thalassovita mangrovi]MYM55485.1 glycosyltransferase [Thalassovita mangrovi]
MTDPRLLTVILNYRTPDMTVKSVDAALRAMQGIGGEILVVDNDSGDGSFERLIDHAQAHGWTTGNRVRVLQSGRNGGFGAGNNFGIQAGLSDGSKPDYVYVLNSDAFPAADAIRQLLNYLQTHPEAGFAGSYIHGPTGDPHLTTFRFPSIASEFEGAIRFGPVSRLLSHKRVPVDIPDHTRPVDWLAGASLMMRREVLDEIGLFDEAFFLYFEETDLCLRAHRAGYQTVFVRESDVAHIGSVSTGMKEWRRVPDYWFDSRSYYFAKNHGAAYAALATLAHVTGGVLHRARQYARGRKPADPPHFLRTLLRHDLAAMFKPRRRAAVPRLTEDLPRPDGSLIVSE